MLDWTPEQLQEELDQGKSVFLKLWKPGCGPCKMSEPALARIEPKYADQMTFAQINAVEYPEMFEIANTEILPVFYMFRDRKRIGQHIGFKGIKKLQEFIRESLDGSGE